jgi:hypothetical protein
LQEACQAVSVGKLLNLWFIVYRVGSWWRGFPELAASVVRISAQRCVAAFFGKLMMPSSAGHLLSLSASQKQRIHRRNASFEIPGTPRFHLPEEGEHEISCGKQAGGRLSLASAP